MPVVCVGKTMKSFVPELNHIERHLDAFDDRKSSSKVT